MVIKLVTSSTRRSTGTGLKKWIPITCSGRAVAMPSFMIGIELVLLARIAARRSTNLSSCAEDLDLHRLVLDDASTTSWRSASRPRSVVNASRATAASRSCLGELARAEAAVERLHEPAAPGLGRRFVDLADEHVEAGTGAHLGDPGPHQAASDDADALDHWIVERRRLGCGAHASARSAARPAS